MLLKPQASSSDVEDFISAGTPVGGERCHLCLEAAMRVDMTLGPKMIGLPMRLSALPQPGQGLVVIGKDFVVEPHDDEAGFHFVGDL